MRHMNETHDMNESRHICLQMSHATRTSQVPFDTELVHAFVTSHFIHRDLKALAVHNHLARILVLIRTDPHLLEGCEGGKDGGTHED